MSDTIEITRPFTGPALLSPADLEARLGVGPTTIHKLLHEGTKDRPPLPKIKIGRCVRVREDHFMEWLMNPTK